MEYYFDELDPVRFQRLVHALLQHQYGDALTTGPLRGPDGGWDAEAVVGDATSTRGRHIRPGRHIFQVKHHRMTDANSTKLRQTVKTEFLEEAKKSAGGGVTEPTFFHLITNVSSSIGTRILDGEEAADVLPGVEGRIWWQSDLVAMLDRTPAVWPAFPELFAGRTVPLAGAITSDAAEGPAATIRAAVAQRYAVDRYVRFRQIDLERELTRLFIDPELLVGEARHYDALNFLLSESGACLLVEGGPGQGKSTVTQMLAQIYRHELLGRRDMEPQGRWSWPEKPRVPLRIELRRFADAGTSLEQYLVQTILEDAGGGSFTVDHLRRLMAESPMLLVLDGLDEVGSDTLRDRVVYEVLATVHRIQATPRNDVNIVLTTRPPAIAGRRHSLENFVGVVLLPLSDVRIAQYVDRWTDVQIAERRDREEVRTTFRARRRDAHVAALAGNPMQLAVLLHLIRMKGAAFPTRRAELYREYFERVIDRDVEKSPATREHRDLITRLHQFLAFEIHALSEAGRSDGTLPRPKLLARVDAWLQREAGSMIDAGTLFKLGEERLGLIVCPRGEGESSVYGFEIQPVREYFAAAHLNDSVAGDAHEIFAELLRRPFWREVATFLAGLRRPNERADLIERARALDRDPVDGWRQRGRTFVHQLILDGVFAQPQYLYEQALDFVADLVDSEVVPFGVMPERFFLGDLVRRVPSASLESRVARMLRRRSAAADVEEMAQLLAVLPAGWDIDRVLAALKPGDPAILPRLRLHSALAHVLPEQTRAGFWEAGSPETWARELWSYSQADPSWANRGLPHELHLPLLEQFAFYPMSGSAWPWQIESTNMVWLFAELESLACALPTDPAPAEEVVLRWIQAYLGRVHQARTYGLRGEIAAPLLGLLQRSATMLARRSAIVVEQFSQELTSCLQRGGIVSAVAARHAAAIASLHHYVQRRLRSQLFHSELSRFYSEGSDVLERLFDGSREVKYRTLHFGLAPDRLQFSPERPTESIAEGLRICARKGERPRLDFLRRAWFRASDCVRMTHGLHTAALAFLFDFIGPHGIWDDHEWLLESDATMVLSVLREAKSPRVLQTVLAMMHLMPSYVVLPAAELLRAMKTDTAGFFADRVFWPHTIDSRLELAAALQAAPEEFALGYRRRAAALLAGAQPVAPAAPLIQFREQLGLEPGSRR